jgi:glycolate oxidase FAD binding subunit
MPPKDPSAPTPVAPGPMPAPIAAACRAVRPAGPADVVAGVQPSVVATPTSTREASDLLRAAASLGLAVVPRGTGTKLTWGNPPRRCDMVVEMTGMDHVVEHEAGDLVATVQAGIGLDALAQALGAAGQRLALDPPSRWLPPDDAGPRSTRGTVGGVLATGVAGPLRLRYGSGRDLLIGITIVRADGTVARSGGKVVKNVAGYDLGKLFAGSRGTLGLITEATFRLHPVPAATCYLLAHVAAAAEAARLLGVATESPHAPVAAEIDWPTADAPLSLAVALEGGPGGVAERAGLLADLLRRDAGAGVQVIDVGQDPPPWWGIDPARPAGLAQATSTARPAGLTPPPGTLLQIAFWPGNLALALADIRHSARAAGLDPAVGGSAAAGLLHATLPADAGASAVAAFVTGLRDSAVGWSRSTAGGSRGSPPRASTAGSPARASIVVLHAPPAVTSLVDPFGPVPSIELMRAVKQRFDPDQMMSPGRFAGGI